MFGYLIEEISFIKIIWIGEIEEIVFIKIIWIQEIMIDNPEIQELPADVWTKVAAAVKSGFVHIFKGDLIYYQTYKITPDHIVADETAQLALTVEEGDVANRTDTNKSYIALNSDNISISGDWRLLAGDAVPDDSILPADNLFEGAPVFYRLERIAGETIVTGFAGITSSVKIDVYIYCETEPGRVRIDIAR